jgi:hypothetical protein
VWGTNRSPSVYSPSTTTHNTSPWDMNVFESVIIPIIRLFSSVDCVTFTIASVGLSIDISWLYTLAISPVVSQNVPICDVSKSITLVLWVIVLLPPPEYQDGDPELENYSSKA